MRFYGHSGGLINNQIEPGAGSREPGAGSREPGAGSREPGAGSKEIQNSFDNGRGAN